jgi:hypothetical protein
MFLQMIELIRILIIKTRQSYEINKPFQTKQELEAYRKTLQKKYQSNIDFTYREKSGNANDGRSGR